jgi:bifunctional non-homologous end joining protein LigD
MAVLLVDQLPEGADWSYELKLDGYRAVLVKVADRVQILSRNRKDLTRVYPAIATAGKRLTADRITLDGEIVALDTSGRPSFQTLQNHSQRPRIVFYAFDVLHLEGHDLTSQARF